MDFALGKPAPALRPLVAGYGGARREGLAPGTRQALPSRHVTLILSFRERREARLWWPGGMRAWIELGDALVGLTNPGQGRDSPKKLGGVAQALKLYVPDVDAHFAHASAAGAEIVSGMRTASGADGSRPPTGSSHPGLTRGASTKGRTFFFTNAPLGVS